MIRCPRLNPRNETTSSQARFRAYLQLMRFPAVFTALADIFLGFALTHGSYSPAENLAALVGASSGLYLAGMVFNDWFDRDLDARERPGRPIPSGRISPRAAVMLASALMILGLACAAFVSRSGVEISLMVAALILAYDGFFKQTPIGPIAMGGCRFLNVMLGASAGAGPTWASPQLLVALAMGVYVAGVTWFARQEADRSLRTHLAAAATIVQVAIVGLAAIVLARQNTGATAVWLGLGALALVGAWIDVRLIPAIREPTPRNVQSSVKRMLLAIVLLDATMVYCLTDSPLLAVAVTALLIPAATLGRWIFIT